MKLQKQAIKLQKQNFQVQNREIENEELLGKERKNEEILKALNFPRDGRYTAIGSSTPIFRSRLSSSFFLQLTHLAYVGACCVKS